MNALVCSHCGRSCFSKRSKWTHEYRCDSRPGAKEYKKKIYKKISESQLGRTFTKDHKQNMSIAAKNRPPNRLGETHSKQTKEILSKICKKQWKNGQFKRTHRSSKLQIEIFEYVKKLGYNAVLEFYFSGKLYDIFIPELNLIIEFNGTYYHMDPRKYRFDEYNSRKQKTAEEIWAYDFYKNQLAVSAGFNVIVVWEYDYRQTENKQTFIKEVINEYG